MIDKKEYILCAAIWYKELQLKQNYQFENRPINCDKGYVSCGFRHNNCMWSMTSLTGLRSVLPEVGEYEQGFLTSKNRFVNREEGAIIAFEAGQISENKKTLYSEDIY